MTTAYCKSLTYQNANKYYYVINSILKIQTLINLSLADVFSKLFRMGEECNNHSILKSILFTGVEIYKNKMAIILAFQLGSWEGFKISRSLSTIINMLRLAATIWKCLDFPSDMSGILGTMIPTFCNTPKQIFLFTATNFVKDRNKREFFDVRS